MEIQTPPKQLLRTWLQSRINADAFVWLSEKISLIEKESSDKIFYSSFSAVIRFTGKAELKLSAEEIADAKTTLAGWAPQYWTLAEAARACILLALPASNAQTFGNLLQQTLQTADMGESLAIYKALPLLPYPETLIDKATEGVRNNMKSAYEAVALHNPFPAQYFAEGAWNQMVVKALFVDSPLRDVVGLDARANITLKQILVDLAHERWAAQRLVSPEIWRLVAPFANEMDILDLQKVLQNGNALEQSGAALALHFCPLANAKKILVNYPNFVEAIQNKKMSWENLPYV